MRSAIKSTILCAMLSMAATTFSVAQSNKEKDKKAVEYAAVVTGRAEKIVATLGVADTVKFVKVRDIIAQQYIDLNKIHDARNAAVKEVKAKYKEDKTKSDAEVKKLENNANKKLDKLHKKYLAKLSKQLNAGQIDMVKDGMTYRVLPITYKAYQDMIPRLTEVQKKQILEYLTEARERAMDAESSDKKHAWFGKYKGKINNYLSAQGIDSQKERKEWEARIKAAQAKKD